ncbi:L-ascorbate peroxidase 3, partial [Frankliniella fusca]
HPPPLNYTSYKYNRDPIKLSHFSNSTLCVFISYPLNLTRTVKNLPAYVTDDIVLYEINLWLRRKLPGEEALKVLRGSGEFSSINAATAVSSTKDAIEIYDCALVLTQVSKEKVYSNKVEVLNLPSICKDNVVLYEINRWLRKNIPDERAVHVYREDNRVSVEFTSVTAAAAVAATQDSIEIYDATILFIHGEAVEPVNYDSEISLEPTNHKSKIALEHIPEVSESDEEGESDVLLKDSKFVSVNEHFKNFLEEAMQTANFTSSKCILSCDFVKGPPALVKVKYRVHKREGRKDSPYFVPCSVIFDGASPEILKDTIFDPDKIVTTEEESPELSRNEKLLEFCNVATWTTPASKALVEACISNEDEYRKPIRHTHFWAQISKIMVEQKFYYTSKQCEARMAKLQRMYNDDNDAANRTGAPGPRVRVPDEGVREILDLMGQLLEGSVKSNPKITASVGYTPLEVAVSSVPAGRARPLVLQRKQSLPEMRLAAFQRRTDVIEKSFDSWKK